MTDSYCIVVTGCFNRVMIVGTGIDVCEVSRIQAAIARFGDRFIRRIYTPADSAKNGAIAGKDTIRQKVMISTRAEDHIAFARQYIDLGFDELYFHCPGPDQRAFLEGYGRDVLPKLRG